LKKGWGPVQQVKRGSKMRTRRARAATVSVVLSLMLLASSNASGNVMGTFSNGTFSHPPCAAPVQCGGQGTSTFRWGDTSSSLNFTGSAFNTPRGVNVVIGTLTFFNSVLTLGTEVNSAVLTFNVGDVVATGADTPLFDTVFDNTEFTLTLHMNITPNVPGDPVASRDDVTVVGVLQNGQPSSVVFNPNVFTVDETFTNSVGVEACFCSLDLKGFSLEVSDPVHGAVAFAAVPAAVPGASTVALFGTGGIVLLLARQRRNRESTRKSRVA
jgi:hypothetical protein